MVLVLGQAGAQYDKQEAIHIIERGVDPVSLTPGTRIAEEFAERFEGYLGGFPPFSISAFLQNRDKWYVLADVFEIDAHVHALIDLPGVASKEDIQIDIQNGRQLIIRAARSLCKELEMAHAVHRERATGRIQREIALPADVALEQTEAVYKNGVLHVIMPKTDADPEKKVDVRFEE